MSDRSLYRILDASLNRANEGLRTIEDHARFVLNNPHLTEKIKHLRHDLTASTQAVDRNLLLANRDTVNDCGTEITTETEFVRSSQQAVLSAAFSRIQQSLRSLEEYGKLISPQLAAQMESLRYRTYTLEKELVLQATKHEALSAARLYLLVDLSDEIEVWLKRLRELALAGADIIQIRDKRADDRRLWQYSSAAAKMMRDLKPIVVDDVVRPRCQLIINDRADIAMSVDADGVHVGQEELPVDVVRQIIGENKLVGLSTHSVEQVREAIDVGADYIGCGPTFPSQTKSFNQYVGVSLSASAARDFPLPAFAIGGINEANLSELLDVGVHRVAVSGAVWGQTDEVERCRKLAQLLRAGAIS